MDGEYEIRVNTGYRKPRFGPVELRDIVISMVVLALAFTIMYRNTPFVMNYLEYALGSSALIGLFGISLALVVVSVLFHEFGHKFTAQKAGLWSEFRMYPMGLVVTLVMSFFGFLFAAPGAVYIMGNMDSRTNGKVSIAGPAINIVLAAIGFIGCFAFNGNPVVIFFYMLASLNSFLALFNLLPVPPLDGSKVLAWNKGIWVVVIAISIAELVMLYYGISEIGLYWSV